MSLFLENKWSDGLSGSVRVLYVVNCPSTDKISYDWLNARTSLHDHQDYIHHTSRRTIRSRAHHPFSGRDVNVMLLLIFRMSMLLIIWWWWWWYCLEFLVVSVCIVIAIEKDDLEIYEYSKKITKIILTQSSARATAIVLSLCIDKPTMTTTVLQNYYCKELMCDDLMIRSCFSTSHRRWIHHACHLRSTIGRIYSVYDSYSTAYIISTSPSGCLFVLLLLLLHICDLCVWGRLFCSGWASVN